MANFIKCIDSRSWWNEEVFINLDNVRYCKYYKEVEWDEFTIVHFNENNNITVRGFLKLD